MKHTLLVIAVLLLSSCGSGNSRPSAVTTTEQAQQIAHEQITTDAERIEPEASDEIEPTAENPHNKSLNDIRFGDWTDEDWCDNDYFRYLRKCFDNYYKNEIIPDDVDLQPYKSVLSDKFYIGNVEPFIMGGLFITIGFLNTPQILYNAVIYSHVDMETETVTGFTLMNFSQSEQTTDLTRGQILKLIKEHPENKLW
jgi:hypothetical protein